MAKAVRNINRKRSNTKYKDTNKIGFNIKINPLKKKASSKSSEKSSISIFSKEGTQEKDDTNDKKSIIKDISSDDEIEKKISEVIDKSSSKNQNNIGITEKVTENHAGEQKPTKQKPTISLKHKEKTKTKKKKASNEKSSHSLFKKKKTAISKQIAKVELADETPLSLTDQQIEELKKFYLEKEQLNNDEWQQIDFYPLIQPFAYAYILQHDETKEKRYIVVEIELDDLEKELLSFINEVYEIIPIDTDDLELQQPEKLLNQQVSEIISDYSLNVSAQSKHKILYYLRRDYLGFNILDPVMKDTAGIEDISCDGAEQPIFIYHRNYGSVQSNIVFDDEEELSSFVVKLAQKCGKHISISNPMLDATMPDGSRIQMTLSTEVSTKGSTFTIRKFKEQPYSPADLIKFNTMSHEMMAYLWLAVQYGSNALISGGTASGKTSVLNAVSLFIPREAKIVSIEETREINLPHPNWIPGVARTGSGEIVDGKPTGEIDLFDLMKAALRQRPEYILVGEIRGREAYVLFQAMATGHTTYSTVHADSTKSLIHRLEGEPINIPRIMLQSLDIVCIQTISKVKNKRVRRTKQIIEIIDIDPTTKEILTNEVFRWDPIKDEFQYSGKSFILDQIRMKKNIAREEILNELKQRAQILKWMVTKNIHVFDEVASITANYLEKPDEILEKIHEAS